MAMKGQKFNIYSDELKTEILNKYFSGYGTAKSLGKEYNISYNKMIYHSRHPELKKQIKRGRPKEKDLTKEDYKERYEILKNTRSSSRYNERKSNIYQFI